MNASEIYRAMVVNQGEARLCTASPPGWKAIAPEIQRRCRRCRRSSEQLSIPGSGSPNAMKQLRHQHGTVSLETIEARPVFDGDALADLRVREEESRAPS